MVDPRETGHVGTGYMAAQARHALNTLGMIERLEKRDEPLAMRSEPLAMVNDFPFWAVKATDSDPRYWRRHVLAPGRLHIGGRSQEKETR